MQDVSRLPYQPVPLVYYPSEGHTQPGEVLRKNEEAEARRDNVALETTQIAERTIQLKWE